MTHVCRILLVEDSRTQALSLVHALEREGWTVDWAPTVEAALEQMNDIAPDLIVLDYYLPGISGDELCRRIRMNLRTRGIPILMLTMDETNEAQLKGLESGADDFLPKSVDSEVLLARVRSLLNRSAEVCRMPALTDPRFRRARLLTIDDSATYQEHLTAELESEGYVLERAMSGHEGLEKIAQQPFDCALVDLVMPDIDGIEVCRQVAATCRSVDRSIALLMLTGRENKEDLTQALEAGADDFVGKSSDMAVLKGRIRALLRRKFCQEDNRRVEAELKRKEVELLRARVDRELAEARAALNDDLERRIEERTSELAEVNRSLLQQTRENEMFVYSVSHDLRSPLVNLQGFSRELEESSQELSSLLTTDSVSGELRNRASAIIDGPVRQSLHYIQQATSRLGGIIEALLRLSRVGRVEYSLQVLDMNDLVRRVLESLRAELTERRVETRVADLPACRGDQTAVEQLIANLVGNALKYLDSRRNGVIEIDALPAAAGDDGQGGMQTYFVKDNGLGIPAGCREKIFQAFQRAHTNV
ncbi:MAG TPA: response regulator, partial [Pirellulales bacterium]|nr:response regulator [Pirellulales bacterium]